MTLKGIAEGTDIPPEDFQCWTLLYRHLLHTHVAVSAGDPAGTGCWEQRVGEREQEREQDRTG